MSNVLEMLGRVPDVIWSGLMAASIALVGVMISNGSNNKRLRLQLAHDAREKVRADIRVLRKDVYLRAVEEIETANIKMASLSNRDFKNFTILPELQTIAASMAKLRLVAESDTSRLAGDLASAFSVLFFRLLPSLSLIQESRIDVEVNDSFYNSSMAEAVRVMKELHALIESGRAGDEVFKALQRSHEFFTAQAQEYVEARSSAQDLLALRQKDFFAILLPELKEISKVQLGLFIAIRRDLGIECDVESLQRQLERQWAVMNAEYGGAMELLEAKKEGQ